LLPQKEAGFAVPAGEKEGVARVTDGLEVIQIEEAQVLNQ